MVNGGVPLRVQDALEAMRRLLGDNDMLAYLVMMTQRLVELHRVLKSTGSLYLHCDPTASHYLKVIMDAIFGPTNFVNEVVWKRATTVKGNFGQGSKGFGPNVDYLLIYSKSSDFHFNTLFKPYSQQYIEASYKHIEEETGRKYRLVSMIGPGGAAKGNPRYEVMGVTRYWRYSQQRMQQLIDAGLVVQTKPGTVPNRKYYLDEGRGVPIQSLWEDVPNLQAASAETLHYPTQKPLALLERVLAASSKEDDVVLDPFCGCGTTIDAAQKLGRRWIGIDVTTLAVDLIDARLRHTYGESIRKTYDILGIPQDLEGARHLFERSPFEFERWCVMMLDGQPNERQVGDKGIDGVIRIVTGPHGESERVLISVKGGGTNPGHVQALLGTVQGNKAAVGVFATMKPPTKAMRDVAHTSGIYTHPGDGREYPRIQIVTVAELLEGKRPKLPPTYLPYFQAQRRGVADDHPTLDFG